MFWREVPFRSVDVPQFLRGQLGLGFQMIAILAVTLSTKAQYNDSGRGCKGSVLKDWRYDNWDFFFSFYLMLICSLCYDFTSLFGLEIDNLSGFCIILEKKKFYSFR